ncbi:MAG: glycosyltransferase family 4 protein [Bacteroidota bacterium]
MIRLLDINFYANTEYGNTTDLVAAQFSSLNYMDHTGKELEVEVVKHIDNPDTIIQQHRQILFFNGRNGFFYLPLRTLRYVKQQSPDLVMIQGLAFPFQAIVLRWLLGRKVKLLAKDQADHPPSHWVKKRMQRIADSYIDQYLFTSRGNAREWIEKGMIQDPQKISEIPVTYTGFSRQDKMKCRTALGMDEGLQYLWVGRMNANKDPLTVLYAFEKYLLVQPGAKLHLVYQTNDLLNEVERKINNSALLKQSVYLHGKKPYTELPQWYSAADFYLSGSHSEGGSGALLEAMACGCIPIVTDIPPAVKVSDNGRYAFHFKAGDAAQLLEVLSRSAQVDRNALSEKIMAHFQKNYSLDAVGDRLYRICLALLAK